MKAQGEQRIVPVRMPEHVISTIDELAAMEDRDRSSMIRTLVREAIDARRVRKP